MPEGPSIVILRELVAELNLENQHIIAVSGTTSLDKERMLNQTVKAFKTWGKHFLICFDGFALRIHLMMFGSYRINESKKVEPKIGLKFKNAELNFYTCDLKYIEGNLDDTYDWRVDIMSEQFDAGKTAQQLKDRPKDFLCDVLLDQTLFSGSGNIIKNEALYRVGLQPMTKVGDLTTAKLKLLATAVKNYAQDFLKWKKANVLKRHWEVYGQKECPKGHIITKANLGKNKRVSFYCKKCQDNPSA